MKKIFTTLKKKKDFEFVYKNSNIFEDSGVIFIWCYNNISIVRMACAISKKVGKACKRNKIRRWFKNALCLLLKKNYACIKCCDVIIKIKNPNLNINFWKVYSILENFITVNLKI